MQGKCWFPLTREAAENHQNRARALSCCMHEHDTNTMLKKKEKKKEGLNIADTIERYKYLSSVPIPIFIGWRDACLAYFPVALRLNTTTYLLVTSYYLLIDLLIDRIVLFKHGHITLPTQISTLHASRRDDRNFKLRG